MPKPVVWFTGLLFYGNLLLFVGNLFVSPIYFRMHPQAYLALHPFTNLGYQLTFLIDAYAATLILKERAQLAFKIIFMTSTMAFLMATVASVSSGTPFLVAVLLSILYHYWDVAVFYWLIRRYAKPLSRGEDADAAKGET